MTYYGIIRFAAVALSIGQMLLFEPLTFMKYFHALAFSHYLLGFYYARDQFVTSLRDPSRRYWMIGIVLLALAISLTRFPQIGILFVIHNSLTDVYLLKNHYRSDLSRSPTLDFSRLGFGVFAQFFMIRNTEYGSGLPEWLLLAGLLGSVAVMGSVLIRSDFKADRKELLDLLLFELISIPLVVFSFYYDLHLFHLILIHGTIWLMLPFLKLRTEPLRETGVYLGLVALTFGGFYFWFSTQGSIGSMHAFWLSSQFKYMDNAVIFWAYWHIVLSLGMSKLNPRFLTRIFYPRVTA